MGVRRRSRNDEINALRRGLDLGLRLIDTAEMYGDGACEEVVGEAISGRRDDAFLVSKVYPHNASRSEIQKACDRSLKRLACDHIDLYLLHWRGTIPLSETLEGFLALQKAGKILSFGVSNFDVSDMEEICALPGGEDIQTNQVQYNLGQRGIESKLIPWLRQRHIPVMAYSPIDKGRMNSNRKLKKFARNYDMTPIQVALAWLLAMPEMIVIPKTSSLQRMQENIEALDFALDAAQLKELDALFPPPSRTSPSAMT